MNKTTYEPTDQELIRWVGAWNEETEVQGAGYHFGIRTPVPGEVAVIHSHGKLRRGVVVSVGRLNAKVALTTPAAIDGTHKGYELTRVAGKAMPFKWVAVAMGSAELADGSFAPESAELADVDRTRLDTERTPSGDEEVYEGGPRSIHPDRSDGFEADDAPEEYDTEGDHPELPSPPWAASEPESGERSQSNPATGSSVVMVLEEVWDAIRANHPDLPVVVIVTGSMLVGPARWGHTRNGGWTDRQHQETRDGVTVNVRLGEMFVAGETLAKGAAFTLETMLHEAAHVLAWVREIKDTSRQHRWHNQNFQKLAEELGLEYPKPAAHPQVGFSECVLTPGTREEYASVIEELDRAIRLAIDLPGLFALGEGDDAPAGGEYVHHGGGKPGRSGAGASTTNNVKAVCGCPTPRIIRASRKVLDEGEIVCGKCREPFEPEGARFEKTDEDEPWSEGGQDTSLED